MSKYPLLAAAAGLALSSIVRADFVVSSSGQVPGTGQLAGDDVYTFQVRNDGSNGTGSNLLAADITMSSQQGLIIRTWDGVEYNTGDPTRNTHADFANRGTADENGHARPGPPASYVSFNPFMFVASAPKEDDATQHYTDFGKINQVEVVGLVNPPDGVADGTAMTFAVMVVPHGSPGTLSYQFASEKLITNVGVLIFQPEPGSLGLLSLGMGGLMLRRRRA